MDNLDILKEQWQKREQELPKLSYKDIYQMLLQKSSSMVKWIFLISIGELLFWTILAFFVPESSREFNNSMGLKTAFLIINIIHYCIFAIFIYLFYVNYRSIKVTDTVKDLMRSILNTRKTVKYFVIYNVGAAVLVLIGVNFFYFSKKEQLYSLMVESYEGYGAIPQESFTSIFFLSQLVFGLLLIGLIMIFYRIIYGILLKRLKRNYNELRKIEM
jgi:magnesium-transporting ATPase (P-type)